MKLRVMEIALFELYEIATPLTPTYFSFGTYHLSCLHFVQQKFIRTVKMYFLGNL